MKKEPLVLAYSGGLDTSYSLKKLSQEGYEVHAVSVNTVVFPKMKSKRLNPRHIKWVPTSTKILMR